MELFVCSPYFLSSAVALFISPSNLTRFQNEHKVLLQAILTFLLILLYYSATRLLVITSRLNAQNKVLEIFNI